MLAKTAVLMLAASIVLGGVTVCPRGALSCPMAKQASHHCCGSPGTLHTTNCCTGGGHLPGAGLKTTATEQDLQHPAKAAAAFAMAAAMADNCRNVSAFQRGSLACGPAPPYTAITLHTTLLL